MNMNAFSITTTGGAAYFVVMLFVHVGIIVLTISFIIRLVIYLKTAGKERTLLRMELGKLAEDIYQIRYESKNTLNQKGDD